jgi:hypothetical protein
VQPILSDGFGHYSFYALPGVYTVVVMFGGKVQQFYIDQSLGNAGSSSASSLLLSTNGTPNFNQAALNFVQGSGITLATDNLGNMTITGSAITPATMTNTVGGLVPTPPNNATQFLNGSGVFSVPPSAGIGLPANGFIWATQNISPGAPSVAHNPISRAVAGEVGVALLILLESVSFTNISIYVATGSGLFVNNPAFVGLYSFDGMTKYIDSGPLDCSTSSQVARSKSFSVVNLPAGTYWYAWGQAGSGAGTVAARTLGALINGSSNAVFTTIGRAANALIGTTSLPLTLGAITPYAYADSSTTIPDAKLQ